MSVLTIGPLTVDLANRTARLCDGQLVRVTSGEFLLLAALVEARGDALSPALVSAGVLGRPWGGQYDRSVHQLVHQLRRKLPTDEDGQTLVRTTRGRGFWMVPALGQPLLPEGEGLRRAKEFLRRAATADLNCPAAEWVGERASKLLQAEMARRKRDTRRVYRVFEKPPVRSVVLLLPGATPGAPPRQMPVTFRQVGDSIHVTLLLGTLVEDKAPATPKAVRAKPPAYVGISERVPAPAKAITDERLRSAQAANGARVR